MENQTKKCIKCGCEKAFALFTKDVKKPNGIKSVCRACTNEYLTLRDKTRRANTPSNARKTCKRCGDDKPVASFQFGSGEYGRSNKCKACASLYEKERISKLSAEELAIRRETTKNWYLKNRKAVIEKVRHKKTGFSPSDIETMLRKQNGACAICGISFEVMKTTGINADHCHTTGAPRGLLCADCNRGLGSFRDDTLRLEKAIAYLKNPPMTEVLL